MRLLILIFLFVVSMTLYGQNYQLQNFVVGNSATTSSNANYTFQNTVGQSAIGVASGANNNANLGFWYSFPVGLDQLNIALDFGWNMISSYVNPTNTDLDSMFKDIIADILLVKNGEGQIYAPNFGIDDIGNWNVLEGYQVYCTSQNDPILEIEGTQVDPELNPIITQVGWNMTAYLRNTSATTSNAYATLIDRSNLLLSKNGEGQIYAPNFGIDDIINLNPKEGYQLYVTSLDTLIYPANSGGGKVIVPNPTPKPKQMIVENTRTGSDMTLLLKGEFDDLTEIGVYDENDKLIGSGVFSNNAVGITVWGDDTYTESKDGALEGEQLNFKVFDGGIIKDINLSFYNIIEGNRKNDISYRSGSVFAAEIRNTNTNGISLNVSPIPANELLKVDISGIDGEKTLSVFNKEGRNIFDAKFDSDQYSIELNDLLSGDYYITVTNGIERADARFVKVQ